MACPKCGQPHMFDVVPEMRSDYPDVSTEVLCPSCVEMASEKNDYEYDDMREEIKCSACKGSYLVSDDRAVVAGDETWMLWKCPECGAVYDLEE